MQRLEEEEAQKKREVKTQGRTGPRTALGGPFAAGFPARSLGRTKNDTNTTSWDIFGGPLSKNLPAEAGNTGSISSLGRSHKPRGS